MDQNTTSSIPMPVPAVEPEAPKKKSSALPWVICVILLLAVGGLLAWKLLDNGNNKLQCETALEKDDKKKDEKVDDSGDSGVTADNLPKGDNGVYATDGLLLDGKGYVYLQTTPNHEVTVANSKRKITDDKDLGTFGTYPFSNEELKNYGELGADKVDVVGYKLPYEDVRYAAILHFGNGDLSQYIVTIDKDGKMSCIALDMNYDPKTDVTYTARKIGVLSEYEGAVSTLETDGMDGIYNIVFFRDGSYKHLDYNLFIKK